MRLWKQRTAIDIFHAADRIRIGGAKMKKATVVVIAVLILSSLTLAKKGTLEANLGYFYPAFEEAFLDIYGGGLTYGGDLTVNVWRNLGIWFGVSSFSRAGELTFTQEETQLSLVSFVLGANYTFFTSPVNFYAGLGARLMSYKESNVLGEVKDSGFGVEAKVGIYKKILAGFFADLFVGISFCGMQPADFKINVGGIEAGIGFGYEF